MVRRVSLFLIAVPLLLTLAGCVAYGPGYAPRHHGGYYRPAPVYVAPAPRPYYGHHPHYRRGW